MDELSQQEQLIVRQLMESPATVNMLISATGLTSSQIRVCLTVLEMKKLVLTYTATFQRHPEGRDHVVTGKFVRHIPVGIALVEKYEPID